MRGLHICADDYVVKPFSVKEVVARVGVILRRTLENAVLATQLSYHDGDLVIDAEHQIVRKHGNPVDTTVSEYRLLSTLARHPKRVFSREELIEKVFGLDFRGDTRTIDTHIKNLRARRIPIVPSTSKLCMGQDIDSGATVNEHSNEAVLDSVGCQHYSARSACCDFGNGGKSPFRSFDESRDELDFA